MKKTAILYGVTISMIAISSCFLNASTTNIVSQDITVKQDKADENLNSSDLSIQMASGQTALFYLRFNYSTAFENLSDALISLRLYNVYPSDSTFTCAITVYGLEDGSAGESFDETTMTWNNKPAYGTALFTQDVTFTPPLAVSLMEFQSEELADFVMASTNNVVSFAFVITGGSSWKKFQYSPRTWVSGSLRPSLITFEDEGPTGTLIIVN